MGRPKLQSMQRASSSIRGSILLIAASLVANGSLSQPADDSWTPARTSWGDPDLQGIYNYGTVTPLERPNEFGGQTMLSDEIVGELEQDFAATMDQDRRDGGNAADVARNYNEVWADERRTQFTDDRRTSLIIDPPNGRFPPRVERELTPEDLERQREAELSLKRFTQGFHASYHDGDIGNRCIIRRRNEGGGHPYLPALYGNVAQIFQSPGYVVIYAEMIHHSRIIPVNGSPHLPENIETWLGNPVGYWEGETLVIRTTNFLTREDIGRTKVVFGNANPATFQIEERFTRTGPTTLEYEVTVSDPETWTAPFTVRVPWNETDEQIYEYQCQELNYDLYYWLSGAREREARGERFDPDAE